MFAELDNPTGEEAPPTAAASAEEETAPAVEPAPGDPPAGKGSGDDDDDDDDDAPPAATDAPPAATDPGTPPANSPKRFRISRKDFEGREADYEIIRRAHAKGISLEAAKAEILQELGVKPEVAKTEPAKPPGETPAAEAATTTPAEPTVESLQREIDDLDAQVQKLLEEDYNPGEARKLEKEIRKKEKQMEEIQARQQSEQASAQDAEARAYEAAQSACFESLRGEFPSAFEEGSPLARALEAKVQHLQKTNPAVFNDPNWPELVVPAEARRIKIAPVAAASSETSPAPAAAAPKPGAAAATPSPAAAAPAVPKAPPKARPVVPAPPPGSATRAEETPSADQQWSVAESKLRSGDPEAAFAHLDEIGERDPAKLLRGAA